ncbi:isoleucine--tRNA ligase [Patescibacteria group bacterium]|nr:isoleucine--tRNA ligase [Patescibacteria group bacterium]MBU1702807.1 isoleucine--tRNA ligase [Patescibacteria group bacterium]MBU1953800.1 isoleucine--tRNA ligase [Patescibacteria group bacterium]
MFKSVNPKQSFPKLEHEILDFWEKQNIFEKSVQARKENKKYVFFDGPPFANGLPHYGHILANALKDAVTRYWTMKGYYVPRTNGWDCHGLPVEYEVEKEAQLSGRKDIEKMGVEKFNNMCRESVFRYTKEWEGLLKRIARWVDFEDSYATLDNEYMESIWWVFKQIWLKEMIYQGYKSMHICPRCETPLSNFEVSQGYKDVTDLSVTAKFKLKDEDTYLLAWTTTPWTLPGNVALCMGPKIAYNRVGVRFEDGSEEVYIVAKELVEKVFKDMNYNVLEKVKPQDLEGKEFEPLLPFYAGMAKKGGFKVVLGDFVTTEEGTGIVHIAPMFGEDDYEIAKKYNLPMIQHVKMDGTFKDEVKPWAGKFVKGQDQNVADYLEEKGRLFGKENFRHSYPHCWRCDTPLLNYSTRSWFIRVTSLKDRLVKNNKKIHWQPPHIQQGRFGKWLEGARDWAISRNRFWGCAIPVWECEKGHTQCIGSIEELKERSGGKLPMRGKGKSAELDLHKPYIDEITFKCDTCDGEMRRIPEVLDCWFESGSMPYAQLHYPFENKQEFEDNFPANFIAEGLDQTRGWFYTLHVLSAILFNKPAFENVIVNGILLAADGEKLSKRKKNYPDPNVLFETQGVDATRMFLYMSTAPLAEDVRFSERHVEEVVKKLSLTLWNAYSFFVTYANIDGWTPEKGSDAMAGFEPKHKLDQWILSELHQLIDTVTEAMDDYNLSKATRPIADFVDGLSNWYIRRSRRRFWKSENDEDKVQAYQTLHIVLVELSKLMAPFMPFLADAIYKNLSGEKSVHMADWPKAIKAYIQPKLNREHQLVRQIVTLGHGVRDKANIKVRQPLALVQLGLPANIDRDEVLAQKDVILEELNVKSLDILKDADEFVTRVVMPNARVLGPKYGKEVQSIIQKAKAGEFEVMEDGSVRIGDFVLSGDEVSVGFHGKEGFDVASSGGVSVVLDTTLTDELKQEGLAREIVRRIQDLRKEASYKVDDRIYVFVEAIGDGEVSSRISTAVLNFADHIKRETLALELQDKGDFEWDKEVIADIEGAKVKVAVRR